MGGALRRWKAGVGLGWVGVDFRLVWILGNRGGFWRGGGRVVLCFGD